MRETNLLMNVQSTFMYKGEVLGLRVPEPDTKTSTYVSTVHSRFKKDFGNGKKVS